MKGKFGLVDKSRALSHTIVLASVLLIACNSDGGGDSDGKGKFDDFAKAWARHGFSLEIDSTGIGKVIWRVYEACSENPIPPCDQYTGTDIIPGGQADIVFTSVEGTFISGEIRGSSDSTFLPNGPVTLALLPYDRALLS